MPKTRGVAVIRRGEERERGRDGCCVLAVTSVRGFPFDQGNRVMKSD